MKWVLAALVAGLVCVGCRGGAQHTTSITLGEGPVIPTATSESPSRLDPVVPSRARQVATLDRALAHINADYARLYLTVSPGPQDVLGYGIGALWSHGIDGAGTTVALLEGWTDPTLGSTLAAFDRAYDLPAARVTTIYPSGQLPRLCPHEMQILGGYGSCSAWGGEVALDVTSVHLIAPYARILLVVAPADAASDAAESVAPPEFMQAVETVSRRHLANVISVSDGSGESTYSQGAPEIDAQVPGELAAAAAGIPLVAATGDCGAVQARATDQQDGCGRTTPFRDITTWADSPWVTAVGGSVPDLAPKTGARRGPDHLWRAVTPTGRPTASAGAGLSRIFARPGYQNRVAAVTRSVMRSVPDITMDAEDGTSQAAPLFAGVLALATQANRGHDLGPINPALYQLGPEGDAAGIEDVVGGNDSFADRSSHEPGVRGYTATRGFDVASGWGTVDAAAFVPSLVAMTRRLDGEAAARSSAAASLRQLQTQSLTVRLTHAGPNSGMDELQVRASRLLPGFPVSVSIAQQTVARLRANAQGHVNASVHLDSSTVAGTQHTATLHSMLITETAHVRFTR